MLQAKASHSTVYHRRGGASDRTGDADPAHTRRHAAHTHRGPAAVARVHLLSGLYPLPSLHYSDHFNVCWGSGECVSECRTPGMYSTRASRSCQHSMPTVCRGRGNRSNETPRTLAIEGTDCSLNTQIGVE